MQETADILSKFTAGSLYDDCCALLRYLKVSFVEVTAMPVPFSQLYPTAMPRGLSEVADKVAATYYIGQIDSRTLVGEGTAMTTAEVQRLVEQGKYEGMLVFAADIKEGEHLTRSEMALLTRGFNRIATAQPVVLFLRQGCHLSLATCERMDYTQQWRDGEKLGKVSILRDIDCHKPHHGHIDILETLGDKSYATFDELYEHWMEVFSTEVLTRKFYGELSDWYAWASQVVRFPNDIAANRESKEAIETNNKLNSEACIRMITRLIFVWFLYCKRLIPKEFFDVRYIHDNLIKDFAPDGSLPLYYNPDESRYYRVILQNLFFAMLNCPITPEGKETTGNRRFRPKVDGYYKNTGYNVNNLMRYEGDFMEGGAAKFLNLANSTVPFLNGGLFDCLDDKPNHVYFDGFSEKGESLQRLHVPDYLFFGGAQDVNLFDFYHENNKRHVDVKGLIDLFKHYYFTVEENTPLDQEVSLDPELLGKAFENLLAAYVPETGTNARKQTGSFYTPREIVQYMVNESIVAHLKRICGDEHEKDYRALLSYTAEDIQIDDNERKDIMEALYNCRILDPACGSGAFPMGMLQQIVHVLKRIDPTNEMWKKLMIEQATQQSKQAFSKDSEQERNERLADIEMAFNKSVNDPDYARKLYLIENCIYGVDIQPVAIQISKLRFFISLVVDQQPTTDAVKNFGIRPLPNLEAKFVAANTLIPVNYDRTFVDGKPEVIRLKDELKELNHKMFLARRNIDKKRLKTKIVETRTALAKVIADSGFVVAGVADKLAAWDMFDQNTSSDFFDPEWMFGVKGGFDIVIGNPPYISVRTTLFDTSYKPLYKKLYSLAVGQYDLYTLFIERGNNILTDKGTLTYIIPTRMLSNENFMEARNYVCKNIRIDTYVNAQMCFDNVNVEANIMVCNKGKVIDYVKSYNYVQRKSEFVFVAEVPYKAIDKMPFGIFPFVFNNERINTFYKILEIPSKPLGDFLTITRGFECGKNDENIGRGTYKFMNAESIKPFRLNIKDNMYCSPDFKKPSKYKTPSVFKAPKLVTKFCSNKIHFALDDVGYFNTNSVYNCSYKDGTDIKFLLGILNCKMTTFWFNTAYLNIDDLFPHIQKNQLESIPIPILSDDAIKRIDDLSTRALSNSNDIKEVLTHIDFLVYHLYGLTYDEVLVVDPETPITREEYEADSEN